MVETLLKLIDLFKKYQIDYCLIGGLAVMLHHGRANTIDIDFYVLVRSLKKLSKIFENEKIEHEMKGNYQIRATYEKVPIDILKADHYIGKEVIHRAVEKKIGDHFIKIATPEDLIILKTLADRSIDRRDIEELREIFKGKLDEKYMDKKVKQMQKKLKF